MPVILFYRERDRVPLLEWLDRQERRVLAKALTVIGLLGEHGFRLERPHAAPLRDDIFELRFQFGHVNYRGLYFFFGVSAVVLTKGLAKVRRVPASEIERALAMKRNLESTPDLHSAEVEL